MRKPQYKIDYELVDFDDGSKTAVHIKTGKYSGIAYHYKQARLTEEGEFAKMTFSYTVLFSPSISENDLIQDTEFQTFIGDILTEILMEKAAADEKIRDNDTEEFDI